MVAVVVCSIGGTDAIEILYNGRVQIRYSHVSRLCQLNVHAVRDHVIRNVAVVITPNW